MRNYRPARRRRRALRFLAGRCRARAIIAALAGSPSGRFVAMPRIPAVPALLALAAIALAAFALALSAGSVAIDPEAVIHALFATGDSTQQVIVRELRLPRAVSAFAAGGCLALAGALLQVLLRNSLADPYVLGVSGGAAAGALTMLLLGAGAWLVPAGAFGGALASTAIVF